MTYTGRTTRILFTPTQRLRVWARTVDIYQLASLTFIVLLIAGGFVRERVQSSMHTTALPIATPALAQRGLIIAIATPTYAPPTTEPTALPLMVQAAPTAEPPEPVIVYVEVPAEAPAAAAPQAPAPSAEPPIAAAEVPATDAPAAPAPDTWSGGGNGGNGGGGRTAPTMLPAVELIVRAAETVQDALIPTPARVGAEGGGGGSSGFE